MNVLDNIEALGNVDKRRLLDLIDGFPNMIEKALEISSGSQFSISSDIQNIVVAGMGGSAMSGDIIAKVLSGTADIPVEVCRDYNIPRFVSSKTLFFALSYSGNTEETLSAFDHASSKGAKIVAVTSGGSLRESAAKGLYPVITIPQGLPPRAALPYLLVPMLCVLERCGILKDFARQLDEALHVSWKIKEECGAGNPFEKNEAKRLSHKLQGKVPVILGSPFGSDVAAFRWKTQFSENSKITSISDSFPEFDHNGIVNMAYLQEGCHQFSVVLLRDKSEQERIRKRIEITKRIISQGKPEISEIWALGGCQLAKILSLTYFGDYVSFYHAVESGVDPTPVTAIDILKKEMAK